MFQLWTTPYLDQDLLVIYKIYTLNTTICQTPSIDSGGVGKLPLVYFVSHIQRITSKELKPRMSWFPQTKNDYLKKGTNNVREAKL